MTSVAEKKALHQLGVDEIADAIALAELSVIDVAEAFIERIKRYDSLVESFSYIDIEAILNEAKELDGEAKAGRLRGPLHGVPFGIKEQFALAGIPTRGDWTDPNPVAPGYDATVVKRLRAAGALLLGKLFMVGPSGTPPTRNPWNLEHTPGGSSSGSGAAVGARFAPFALSEQTGGSGIRPAAYCGVSGLKPTYGRNPRYGMFQMAWSHDTACIIGTSMEGIARVFAVTSGHDPNDPSSVQLPPARPEIDTQGMRPPKIGVVRNFFPEMQETEMNAAIDRAAERLEEAGATIVDVLLPEEFGMAFSNLALVGGPEGAVIGAKAPPVFTPGNGGLVPKSKFAMLPRPLWNLLPATYYLQAQRMRRYLRDLVDRSLSEYDAVMMATAPGAAPKGLASSGDFSLLAPWTHLGQPAISIPGGLDPDGMPLGLQLVAPTLQDETLLATGAWCENALGRLPVPTPMAEEARP